MKGDDDYVEPFFWVPEGAPRWVMNRLKAHRATVHPNIKATGLDGKTLVKVTVQHPNQLWEIKDKCNKWTYEADLNYLDQILLTNYPDKIPEFKPLLGVKNLFVTLYERRSGLTAMKAMNYAPMRTRMRCMMAS